MNERIVNANIKLQDENKLLLEDIKTLIRYIIGQDKHEDEVKNLIDKYSKYDNELLGRRSKYD